MLAAARTSKRWSVPVSLAIQLGGIGLLLLLPLIYGERLPFMPTERATVYLPPAPHPPLPPAPTNPAAARPLRVFHSDALIDPTHIPPHPVILNDPVPTIPGSELMASGPGRGVPYGIDVGDLLSKAPPPAPEPPRQAAPKPAATQRAIRVSNGVQEARRISYVLPSYPPLAREAHISGTVELIGVIATDGTIQSLRVISGHPLLVKAAVDAVRQWRYRPTLLNGQPVEVIAPITVTFSLSQ